MVDVESITVQTHKKEEVSVQNSVVDVESMIVQTHNKEEICVQNSMVDVESMIVQTHNKEEICVQNSTQVMDTGGDIKDDLACKKSSEINNSHHVKLYFNTSDSSMSYTRNGPAIGIAMAATEEVKEVYLKNMFMLPPNHEFYCPSCDVCIDKVLYCTTQQKVYGIEPSKVLLKGPPISEPQVPNLPLTEQEQEQTQCLVRCSTCFTFLVQKGKDFITGLVSCGPSGLASSTTNPPEPEHFTIPIQDESSTTPSGSSPIITNPGSSKGWEILKSIVYGGLAQLLASLSVVTSAASADATTLSIVSLSIANLIGGLTVLGHNLRDLKSSQPREETETQVDKYYELLGKRDNFYLHAFVAILSFLIFGLVPPIAYGFSFRESNDKDLKLAAVAIASLICITLLGIAKAHIQGPHTYMTYFKTVSFYVTSGVLASLLSYEAGALVNKLVQQLGWFHPKSNFGLAVPGVSVENFALESY